MSRVTSYEFYHRSGSKVMITDIPILEDEILSFRTKMCLEKLIDHIEQIRTPNHTYSYIDYLELEF
ncbi:DUF2535 family protein [Desertibacillus haloalkaliphilus]|uniref:DUF2535 family protein n=1 Tax=Desertibacillus haloalkaliphilus TaxID=1328930 RepID=UPI001C280707|nr:DUF2535 family protein [Desertibacillus haloalkaliphilus]MBU8905387.1 DUF2535 family protein [Desertibacillus haloalkaliphilus]